MYEQWMDAVGFVCHGTVMHGLSVLVLQTKGKGNLAEFRADHPNLANLCNKDPC